MNVIEAKDLYKIYADGDQQINAVNGVNLTIEKGEFTAIVGPSGSGKTTLLNMIGGLDKPSMGSIKIDQEEMSSLSANQLIDFRLNNIGFVFQAYNLIPVLTAEENVEFTMLLQKRPYDERKKRVKELLEKVGLAERHKNRPSELSGGQQQRVAVARALAPKPKFILADEPTANLDSKSTENLLDLMLEMNKEEGITFLFSTHDQRVIDHARRVIKLEDGKIKSDEKHVFEK
ncbi:ABC transporter ATP-binding protein [Lacihabitans sp. LS3-19]|uniref:ABC transporter ATP-binding protein n=1 Tax=Lacihabitans sp. LS3-19 TaxID=2487335 RepID=UPI0020CD8719|nr:ABC transporter ATP-binding protein [Lacihabitans sp. LS3-19]MCP9770879.1 ABC transporter ATP-binding protein [Lacihabitans sp. LS3-19]